MTAMAIHEAINANNPIECDNATLLEVLKLCASHYSDKIAMRSTTETWTYHDLENASNRLAQVIINHDPNNAPIAQFLKPGPKMIPALLGSAKVGLPWSALDTAWPKARIYQTVEDLGSRILLVDNHTFPIAKKWNDIGCDVINIDEKDIHSPCNWTVNDIAPESPFCIIYTSGSTGKPKGVIQTHGNILHYVKEQSQALFIRPKDRFSQFYIPVYMTGIMSTFRALLNGATLFFYDSRDGEAVSLAKWIGDNKITLLHLSPSLFQHMIESSAINHNRSNLTSVRLIYMTGEPVSKHIIDLYKKWFAPPCILVNNLGSTEASSHSRLFIDHKFPNVEDRVPVGHPVIEKEIFFLDQNGVRLPKGQVGEIAIYSQYLSPGYWGDSQLTHRKFRTIRKGDDKRLYLTGDLGKMRPNGCLEHLGRSDYQVQIRGFRVELGDIDSATTQHPGVRHAVTLCIIHRNTKKLVSYVVAKEDWLLSEAIIREFLKTRLPNHMIPNVVVLMDHMPLTPNGKIDRNALPEYNFSTPLTSEKRILPRNAIEIKMAEMWGRLLDIRSIGIEDNFFKLGGDSLLAARLMIQIEKVFKKNLPLTTILHNPTIKELISCLDIKSLPISRSSIFPIKPSGTRPPLFLVHPLNGNVLCYMDLCPYLDAEQPLYALQALGFAKGQAPLKTIEEMAAHYLREIKTVQPKGPYRIGGACMGGMVAFEMACQLSEQNQDVALLAMIDAPNPLRFMAKHGAAFTLANSSPFIYYLKKAFTHAKNGRYIDAYTKCIKIWANETFFNLIYSQFTRVREANKRARNQYQGRIYSGTITFFWAAGTQNNDKSRFNPNLGWIHLAPKGIRIVQLPIKHRHFLRESNIRPLARALDKYIK